MKNISIFIGDEIYFKDNAIKEFIGKIEGEVDLLTIDLDEQRKYEPLLSDMNVHLVSYDFFQRVKVGVLRTKNLKVALGAIEYFSNEKLQDAYLVIDVFNDGTKLAEFKRKAVIKKLPPSMNIDYFMALKSYEEDKLLPFIDENFKEFNISFETEEDREKSIIYVAKNSKLSFSNAFNEIRKLRYLNKKPFTYMKIVDAISDNLCTDRYYILDSIIESSTQIELMKLLELYFPKFNKKDVENFLSDISDFIKDYIVFCESGRCLKKSNYYKLKQLKFKIENPKEFLIKINQLLRYAREGKTTVLDYLILYIYESFVF